MCAESQLQMTASEKKIKPIANRECQENCLACAHEVNLFA